MEQEKKEQTVENTSPNEEVKKSSQEEVKVDKVKVDEAKASETKKDATKKDKKEKKSKEEVLIESLQAQVAKLEADKKSELEEYLKSRADLENIKKRVINDSIEQRKYASQGLVSSLLQPVDMLVKVASMQTENPEMQNFLIGFKMIATQLTDILKSDGVSEIEALNKPFDPNFHQAISKEKRDGVEPGIVIEVLQTGYKYKDHIIKPAMVKVSE